MKPLEGIRVIEVGQYIAAPYCALMLADQGADVIKVERPLRGDPRREYDPLVTGESGSLSGGFLTYNRGKKSVALDLNSEEGRQSYRELVAGADVVVENLRPGIVEKLGIGYADLRGVNPRIVYAAISGYGRSSVRQGPYADRPAFDTVAQAMGGMMDVTGEIDGPPLPGVTGFADIYSGVHAAFGILTALQAREKSGHGALVDISMYDVVASLMERELMLWEFTGNRRERGLDTYAPVGTLAASDGHVAFILPTQDMWIRLCRAVDRLDLLTREDLETVRSRSVNFASVIRPELEAWTRRRTRREIVEHLSSRGLPVGEVQTIEEVFSCSHLSQREMFLDVDDPIAGRHRVIRTPLRIDEYEVPDTRSAPQLGAHNADLLSV
jgi:crotonobetainyl-CoA:carnitine CoA-transferase CaiB-like acyl-CoA transferase